MQDIWPTRTLSTHARISIDHEESYDDETKFLPKADVLLRAFMLLLEGARLEDSILTPQHLQPCNYPEMGDAYTLSSTFLASLDEEKLEIGDFIELVEEDLRAGFPSTPCDPIEQFVPAKERQRLQRTDRSKIVPGFPLRPGFEAFLHRLLSRAVYFQRSRACNCSPGFHQHGLRTYYNAREVRNCP